MSFADLKKLKKLPNLEANDRRHYSSLRLWQFEEDFKLF